MINFDVLVIGAGPAGCATAISLARSGYEVALLDKQLFPREKLCGDFINPINWPMFRELGVEELVLQRPHTRVTGFRLTSPWGASAETMFSRSDPSHSFGLGLARSELDYVLLQRAESIGAIVRTGGRVEKLLRRSAGWQLKMADGQILRGRVLVGADGRNSWVARQLGMVAPRARKGRAIGFSIRLETAGASGERIALHMFPGGYAGLVGIGDGKVNLGLAVNKCILPRFGVEKFLLAELLPKNPYLKSILACSEPSGELRSVYPVYFPKRRSFSDSALLVGDAARVTEPVTGEGIYFAMQSGILAAQTLEQALCAGDVSANFLWRYERVCARAFRPRLAINSLLRFAVYRPRLLDWLIQCSAKNNRLLSTLVDAVCCPAPAP